MVVVNSLDMDIEVVKVEDIHTIILITIIELVAAAVLARQVGNLWHIITTIPTKVVQVVVVDTTVLLMELIVTGLVAVAVLYGQVTLGVATVEWVEVVVLTITILMVGLVMVEVMH